MSLKPNENIWVKVSLIIVAIVVAIVAWAYLAGGIFLAIEGMDYNKSTPFTLYQYWIYYGTQPDIQKWLYVSSGVSLAVMVLPFLIIFAPAKRSLFGDARFANRSEIKKAGLLSHAGIIVGMLGKQYLMFGGSQHVLLAAPTRSGKGVGIVIPNLLNWPESVVVLDIKQENWDITSGYRRKYGQKCFLFNPVAADYRTHRYNPLAYIRTDPNFRIDDVQKIANMLYPDIPGTDVIWTATPRNLFLGLVLLLIETPGKPLTMGQVLRESLADGDGAAYFAKMINDRVASGNPLSKACVRGLNSYISIDSAPTRTGVMTSFRARLEVWMNPLVDAATSANDFDLREIRKQRISIYIGVTPDNLKRMAPLLNLFFQQLIDLNTRELPSRNPTLKYKCLLLMDEFTAMGAVDTISHGISFIAGYGLRLMPIIQSPAQLVQVYGKEAKENFATNHALNIVFPPKASETDNAEEISKWLGYQTVKGVSLSKGKGLFAKKQESQSLSDQRRALMLPQEITGLGAKRELIVVEDTPPIKANKIRYYKDRVFIDRLKEISPSLKQLRSKLPSEAQLEAAIMKGELGAPVPLIDMEAHHAAFEDAAPVVAASTVKKTKDETKVIERPVVADDIPKLAKLGLASFSLDFSQSEPVYIEPGSLDIEALNRYADTQSLCAGLVVAADAA